MWINPLDWIKWLKKGFTVHLKRLLQLLTSDGENLGIDSCGAAMPPDELPEWLSSATSSFNSRYVIATRINARGFSPPGIKTEGAVCMKPPQPLQLLWSSSNLIASYCILEPITFNYCKIINYRQPLVLWDWQLLRKKNLVVRLRHCNLTRQSVSLCLCVGRSGLSMCLIQYAGQTDVSSSQSKCLHGADTPRPATQI